MKNKSKPETKWCEFCQEKHPFTLEFYHANKQQTWGLHLYCKKERNNYKNTRDERIALKNKILHEERESERRKELLS